jgi:hypothetical protein
VTKAEASLRWSFKTGAAFVLKARAKIVGSKPNTLERIEGDGDLHARYEARFAEVSALTTTKRAFRRSAEDRTEVLITTATLTGRLGDIVDFVRKLQGEAIRRALIERNRPALAKWDRERKRRGGETLPRARAQRGRPSDRAALQGLRTLGLSKPDAEDVLFLAGLRLPPPPRATRA